MVDINLDFESDVFEYCEIRFDQLKAQDNGYHPNTHDKIVFEDAAKKFNITVEQVDDIYDRATKKVAQIYIKKKGKMTKKQMLSEMMAIVKENKDFPFRDDNNTPLPKLESHSEIIMGKYNTLSTQIGMFGWVIPRKFIFKNLDEMLEIEPQTQDMYDSYFNQYFDDNKIRHIITEIRGTNKLNPALLKLFNECTDCFWEAKYQIAINAFISILEGCLSTYWPEKNNIRMMMVCSKNRENAVQQHQPIKELIWNSTHEFIKTLYNKSAFEQDEPIMINRHWILHGRTQTEWDKIDCIRLLNAICTVATLAKNTKLIS